MAIGVALIPVGGQFYFALREACSASAFRPSGLAWVAASLPAPEEMSGVRGN